MNVFMNAETLPVLGRSDVVVIGGSFAGIARQSVWQGASRSY